MQLTSLEDVFIEQLRDLYSAETQIIKALPKMAKTAATPELRAAFEEHLQQTRRQVGRLDQIFEAIGESSKGKKCKGMEGLLEEGKETLEMKKEADAASLDAAIIADAQRVEHYEIAGYGTVCAMARQLGQREALDLLKQTLNEEEQADKKLSEIAARVNLEASESAGREDARSASGKRTRHAR